MLNTELILPEDFADYGWEVESKGVFWDALVRRGERQVGVTFYDPTRLAQDLAEELSSEQEVLLFRVIVIPKVNTRFMEQSIVDLPDDFFS